MKKNELVDVPCPVCQSGKYSVYLPNTLDGGPPVFGYKWTEAVGKSYRYVTCADCYHIYASPIHNDVFRFYEDVADEGYKENNIIRMETAKEVLKVIRKFKPTGTLLDVGCGTGDFLFEAKNIYNVTGLELSKWALQSCEEKGLNVNNKTVDQFAKTKKKFDIITLWGVIEHLENPRNEINLLQSMLKKDGILCIWTGDSSSVYAKIFKRRWWYIMGQHLQLFSRSSLNKLMKKENLSLILETSYPYVMSVEYLGKRLGAYWFAKPVQWFTQIPLWKKKKFKLVMSDQIFSIYQKSNSKSKRT